MILNWSVSVYDSVENILSHNLYDLSLDIQNTTKPISIKSNTIKDGFLQFIRTDEYRNFTNCVKNYHWYYSDTNGIWHYYAPFTKEISNFTNEL